MVNPNFKRGKPVAQVLVVAILAYATDHISSNTLNNLKIQLDYNSKSYPTLRVKGDLKVLRTLVQICKDSCLPWAVKYSDSLDVFLQESEQKQISALKNAVTCLFHRQLIEDQREVIPQNDKSSL